MLIEDEKELGVVLVDIGSGTTDIAISSGGATRHTAVIPIAGDQVTNGIAMAPRTPTPDAGDVKIQCGIAKQVLADPDEMIDVPGADDHGSYTLSRWALAAVVEPCVEELLSLIHQVIRKSGYEELLSSGAVFTGGTVMISGMVELGEDVLLKSVRVGAPEYRDNLHEVVRSSCYATMMGLLQEGRVQRVRGRKVVVQPGSVKQIWAHMKEWLIGNF